MKSVTEDVTTLRETLDRLRLDVDELRASRRRLVLGADADRRRIERELHDGVQQDLVALAVNLQLARPLVDTDAAAAGRRLEEMGRDVQQALDETAQLAQRIYPPLLEGGLGVALRSAAASAGVPISLEVPVGATYAHEVAGTIYLCSVEALEHATAEAGASVTVRDELEHVVFEIVARGSGPVSDSGFGGLRDRVEALGGRLTVASEQDGVLRVDGVLPLTR